MVIVSNCLYHLKKFKRMFFNFSDAISELNAELGKGERDVPTLDNFATTRAEV